MEKELEWERKVKVKLQGWASEREKIKYRDVKCKINTINKSIIHGIP